MDTAIAAPEDTYALARIGRAIVGRDWSQRSEDAIDLRVCECCPTAAAVTSARNDSATDGWRASRYHVQLSATAVVS